MSFQYHGSSIAKTEESQRVKETAYELRSSRPRLQRGPLRYTNPTDPESIFRWTPPESVIFLGPTSNGDYEIIANGKVRHRLEHIGLFCAARFSNDGKWLATASTDDSLAKGRASMFGLLVDWDSNELQRAAEIKIWNVRTGRLAHSFRGHSGNVADIAFHPNGNRIATVGSAAGPLKVSDAIPNELIIWDVQSGLRLLTLDGQGDDLQCVEFSDEGNLLAAAGRQIHVWDATEISDDQLTPSAALFSVPDETGLEEEEAREDSLNIEGIEATLSPQQLTEENLRELSRQDEVRKLTVHDSSNAPYSPLRFPGPALNITELIIWEQVNADTIKDIAKFKQLQSLHLTQGRFFVSYSPLVKLPKLRRLAISGWMTSELPVKPWQALNDCQGVEVLSLEIGDSFELIRGFADHPKLNTLSLSAKIPERLPEEFVSAWRDSKLTNVKLRVHSPNPYYRPELADLELLNRIGDLTQLEIDLSEKMFIDPHIFEAMPQLKKLKLRLDEPENLRETLQVVCGLDQLEELEVSSSFLSDSVLQAGEFRQLKFGDSLKRLGIQVPVVDEDGDQVGVTTKLKWLQEKLTDAVIEVGR